MKANVSANPGANGNVLIEYSMDGSPLSYVIDFSGFPNGAADVRFIRWTLSNLGTPVQVPAGYDSASYAGRTLSFHVTID